MPSIYFAYQLFDEKRYNQRIENFIQNEFTNNDYTVIYKKTTFNSNPKKIELAFISKRFNSEEIKNLNTKLFDYNITNTTLKIKQDTLNLGNDILNEINNSRKTGDQKDILISQLKKQLSANQYDNSQIVRESKILFPEIKTISIANHTFDENTNKKAIITVVLYQSDAKLSSQLEEKLKLWLQQRLEKDSIAVFRQ